MLFHNVDKRAIFHRYATSNAFLIVAEFQTVYRIECMYAAVHHCVFSYVFAVHALPQKQCDIHHIHTVVYHDVYAYNERSTENNT